MDHLTKVNKKYKFKMAVAGILNFIYRWLLIYYCTYLHEIWHVYYAWGPTYTYAKILNKNKIQYNGGRHLGFLHK